MRAYGSLLKPRGDPAILLDVVSGRAFQRVRLGPELARGKIAKAVAFSYAISRRASCPF